MGPREETELEGLSVVLQVRLLPLLSSSTLHVPALSQNLTEATGFSESSHVGFPDSRQEFVLLLVGDLHHL